VREVANVVERALIQSAGQQLLTFDDVMSPLARVDQKQLAVPPVNGGREAAGQPVRLNDIRARHIARILEMTGGKIEGKNGAARLLGMHPSTLRNRIRKLKISPRREKLHLLGVEVLRQTEGDRIGSGDGRGDGHDFQANAPDPTDRRGC
jgi:transcriptional regulator with GAF, ATPase, and Fis domain